MVVKLSEFVVNCGLLYVEDSHRTRLETSCEYRQVRVRCHAQRLVNRACELNILVIVVLAPESDCLVPAHSDNTAVHFVVFHTQD